MTSNSQFPLTPNGWLLQAFGGLPIFFRRSALLGRAQKRWAGRINPKPWSGRNGFPHKYLSFFRAVLQKKAQKRSGGVSAPFLPSRPKKTADTYGEPGPAGQRLRVYAPGSSLMRLFLRAIPKKDGFPIENTRKGGVIRVELCVYLRWLTPSLDGKSRLNREF